jgi:NAD(P)-dependent dehydrogenase (short-subunit alcohol dehydrogenase family)
MNKKIAVITGASSGIGQSILQSLVAADWQIVSLSHSDNPVSQAAKAYVVDLGDLAATTATAKRIVIDFSRIDAFIHIAGIWHDERAALADKPLAGFTPEQIIATMNVGVTAPMILCSTLLPNMPDGIVIGISGTFSDGAAGWLPYYTSKRALEDFLLGLSQDYPSVTTFGISPADTATPAYARFYPQYLIEAQPPQNIATLALKLLNGQNDFVSGDIIELRQGRNHKAFHA